VGKFAESLKSQKPATRGTLCSVRLVLQRAPADERAELSDALTNQLVPAVAIEKAIAAAYGLTCRRWIIQRHRRGDCACDTVGA
jgi:hypothetical protein